MSENLFSFFFLFYKGWKLMSLNMTNIGSELFIDVYLICVITLDKFVDRYCKWKIKNNKQKKTMFRIIQGNWKKPNSHFCLKDFPT